MHVDYTSTIVSAELLHHFPVLSITIWSDTSNRIKSVEEGHFGVKGCPHNLTVLRAHISQDVNIAVIELTNIMMNVDNILVKAPFER